MSDLRSAAACPNCGGTGGVCSVFCDSADPTVDAHPHHVPCPACGSTGLAGLEAAAKAIQRTYYEADLLDFAESDWHELGDRQRDKYRNEAAAAIAAWLAEIERTE